MSSLKKKLHRFADHCRAPGIPLAAFMFTALLGTASARAEIVWEWSIGGTEAGTMTTDGLPSDTGSAHTFKILALQVTQSALQSNVGIQYGGMEGNELVWDGASAAFRNGDLSTQQNASFFGHFPSSTQYTFFAPGRQSFMFSSFPSAFSEGDVAIAPLAPDTPESARFIVYDVKGRDGASAVRGETVAIQDPLGEDGDARSFELQIVDGLAAPAAFDGEGIAKPDRYLLGIKIKPADKGRHHRKLRNVLVSNEFGDTLIDTIEPDRLLVAATARLDGSNSADPDGDADHYRCYKSVLSEDDDGFERRRVTIMDRFDQKAVVEIGAPRHLCSPADLDGEGISDRHKFLLCYRAKRSGGEPGFRRVAGVHTNNRFGEVRLDVKHETALCVPSEIDLRDTVALAD